MSKTECTCISIPKQLCEVKWYSGWAFCYTFRRFHGSRYDEDKKKVWGCERYKMSRISNKSGDLFLTFPLLLSISDRKSLRYGYLSSVLYQRDKFILFVWLQVLTHNYVREAHQRKNKNNVCTVTSTMIVIPYWPVFDIFPYKFNNYHLSHYAFLKIKFKLKILRFYSSIFVALILLK